MKNQNSFPSGYYEADDQLWRAEPDKTHVERFRNGKWGDGDLKAFWYYHTRISHDVAQEMARKLGHEDVLPTIEEIPV